MDISSAVILGAVQGLTEFLPVSSTGHLILARELLGLQTDYGLSVDAVLQLATALAIFIYFRRTFFDLFSDFIRIMRKRTTAVPNQALLAALVLGTIPATVFGFILEDVMETTFRSAGLVALSLVIGSVVMWAGERWGKHTRELHPLDGFFIGFFQSLALIPGMSRSGMTIAGGLLLGLSREDAARFGFMLGFPLLFGSGLKKLVELESNGFLMAQGFALLAGAVSAFVVGFVVIHYLLRFLRNHSLYIFIFYRIALAAVVFASLTFL